MVFSELDTDLGMDILNTHLATRSYIEGYQPTQADAVVFAAITEPPHKDFSHALRWFNHIRSYAADEKENFPGEKKSLDCYGPPPAENGAKAEDDDEIDLFGSDDEADEEVERLKKERVAAYEAKKSKKPAAVAKSNIILDVKPWDDETDMGEIERCVRSIEMDGLVFGTSKLVPVGYGIKKLQISCVVEDEKVGTDDLEEAITAFDELVQSVDVAAFNKI